MADTQTAKRSGSSLLPMLVAVLLIPAALGSSHTIFNDGDVSWHIASGRWILEHGRIPTTDPFSFTWMGKHWVPFEWLADVIYASGYRLAGYAGVSALATAALMALNAIVYFNAARWIRPVLVGFGLLIVMNVVLIPMLLARPHLFVWPLLAAWMWVLMRAREKDRAPPLPAALLMSLWANLHGSFVFGLAIAAAFGLEALISSADRIRAFRQWLLFGVACAIAVCINANGLDGALYPFKYTDLEMLPMIDEWKPSSVSVTPFFFVTLAIIAVLIVWKRPRLHSVRWLLLAACLGAALYQARHQAMFVIVAAMILPEGLARGQQRARGEEPQTPVVIAAVGALLLLAVRLSMPLTPPENQTNPWKLIASVPPELRSQPVLNYYSFGGPLILSGIRPYIDGRGDMYGDPFVLGYGDIVHGNQAAFDEAVRRWNIRWVIMAHDQKKFIAMLRKTPGWRQIRHNEVGAVYVRS